MLDPNLFPKAVLQNLKGIKESTRSTRYVDELPPDGNFPSQIQDAYIDPDGR